MKAGIIFKDTPRFHGTFTNFDKSGAGTGGLFIDEADQLVDHILKEDKDVFTELLTTDKFFVYHKYSNEKSQRIIDEWKELYKLSEKTFVEESDSLKAKGAGAGLTDND